MASSSLIVGATVGLAASRSSSKSSGMPTMGLKVFSFSTGEKSSFFAGESFILRESIADATYQRVSMDASNREQVPEVSRRTCLEGVDSTVDIVERRFG